MPRSTVNFMLSIAAAIAGVPLYFLAGTLFDRGVISIGSDFPWSYLFGVIATLIIVSAWAIIWRKSIPWTGRRAALSAFAFVGSWLAMTGVGYLLKQIIRGEEMDMFLPLLGVACALSGVLLAWRETAPERRARLSARAVPCPACGYNLAGIKESHCPECGTEFTLAQIAGVRAPVEFD